MSILDEMVSKKRQEIAAAKAAHPLEELQKEAEKYKSERRPFRKLLEPGLRHDDPRYAEGSSEARAGSGLAKAGVLIAEIKPKSPSAGELIAQSPLEVADLYAKSGADIVSVLTDKPYFGGSLELLKEGRARVPQAILRKDFIVDEYQVYETFLSGADAFLLIASILSEEDITKFMGLGEALGLDHLVEVHDAEDIEKALRSGAKLIGINNRDLESLKVDVETTQKLIQYIPDYIPVVSESGIETAADVRRVRGWGARGILVGTSILQSDNPVEKINELKQALV